MANTESVTGINSSTGKLVAHIIIRTLVSSIIAFILYVSCTTVAVGIGTKEIGYTILYSTDEQSYTEVYKHYYKDGDDNNYSRYENDSHYYKTPIRSQLTKGQTAAAMWTAQCLTLIIMAASIYGVIWRAGDSDANKAELGGKSVDRLRGIKIALLANIPFAAFYITFVLLKIFGIEKKFVLFYKIATYFMFAFNETIMPIGNASQVTAGKTACLAVVLLPLIIICVVGYYFGRKHIILKNKIIYKK